MASQAALICKDVTADFFGVYYLAQTQIDPKVPLHVLKEMTLRSQENEKSYQRFLDRNFHSDPQRALENILEHISNEKFAIAPNGKLNSWLTPNRLFAAYQENLKKQVKVKTQVKWIPEIQGRGLFADQLIKRVL